MLLQKFSVKVRIPVKHFMNIPVEEFLASRPDHLHRRLPVIGYSVPADTLHDVFYATFGISFLKWPQKKRDRKKL